MLLEQSLERILAWHRSRHRKVIDLLQPGLTAETIDGRVAPLAPRADVVRLYEWRDGTLLSQDFVLNDHYLIPGYYLMSLDDGLHAYRGLTADTPWSQHWFPILASGGGDYYGVDDVDPGHVIHYIRGHPTYLIQYSDLTSMMQSVAQCYESGVYAVDDSGFFEVDLDAEAMIARQFNPGMAYWQPDRPSSL
jgi:hypothetical protein